MPAGAQGLVFFVHSSGSSRNSHRNQSLALTLNQGGLGTFLFDLLTAKEEQQARENGVLRFDIGLLAQRTLAVSDWLTEGPQARLNVGYFGSGTGAAAALIAAARSPETTRAVVLRGGRPDLAGDALHEVEAPVLFLVGEQDEATIKFSQRAMSQLREEVEKRLEMIPGASDPFEERGASQRVALQARHWFQEHLAPAAEGITQSTRATQGEAGGRKAGAISSYRS